MAAPIRASRSRRRGEDDAFVGARELPPGAAERTRVVGGAGHQFRAHPVREEQHLFLDAVLHLPALAIELLIQRLRRPPLRAQIRHNVAWVFLALDLLGLGTKRAIGLGVLVFTLDVKQVALECLPGVLHQGLP